MINVVKNFTQRYKALFFNEMQYENSNQSIFIMFLRDRGAWKKKSLIIERVVAI